LPNRVFLVATFLITAFEASAAVTPNSFVAPQTPTMGSIRFVAGTDALGTAKTLYTAGANGARCYSIMAGNNIPASIGTGVLIYPANVSANYIYLSGTSVASGAGSTPGVPLGSLMPSGLPVDANGNAYLQLSAGSTLQVLMGTGWSSATTGQIQTVYAVCADF